MTLQHRFGWGVRVALGGACAAALGAGAAAEDRTFDGSGNNLGDPSRGAAGALLVRAMDPEYADGMWQMARPGVAGPRQVSNAVCAQVGERTNARGLSDMLWQWGQFLDHDIGLTPAGGVEVAMIETAPDDPFFLGSPIPFTRSIFDPATGTSVQNPRRQINEITAYIDASNVYGSSEERADALRRNDGTGKLKTASAATHPGVIPAGAGDLLPFNDATVDVENDNGPRPDAENLKAAGDVRANEQVGLTAIHTLFVREHNRLCDELSAANPGWTGDEIYERARKIVGAQMQIITYEEFLPALLGPGALSPYAGYDPSVDAGIANIFAHAAYRIGHSMLSGVILRLENNGDLVPEGALLLRDMFFQPERLFADDALDAILKGLTGSRAQEIDPLIVDDVRNFLFGQPGAGGMDLASLNLQRGRDHGLPDYNSIRKAFGLAEVASFSEISSDPAVVSGLESVYTNVDSIDPWVGLIAEDHVPGGSVGPTMLQVLADQFERLRDGDRFWWEIDPELDDLHTELATTTLADVIRRNTSITNLQDNVFFAPVSGDINGSGLVNGADLSSLLSKWGPCGEGVCIGDFNGDGWVNGADLSRILASWGM